MLPGQGPFVRPGYVHAGGKAKKLGDLAKNNQNKKKSIIIIGKSMLDKNTF